MDYIGPILSFLISATFAVLLFGIRGRGQVKPEDQQGINWFIGSFMFWSFVALITIIAVKYGATEINIIIWIKVIVSTLNSICLLMAIGSIETDKKYWGSGFVNWVTRPRVLVGMSAFVIACTTFLLFVIPGTYQILNSATHEPEFPNNPDTRFIWMPDILFSLLTVTALALKISRAFKERDMSNLQWLIYGMLFFLLLTQFYQLIKPTDFTRVDFQYILLAGTLVSLSYKVVFCMLILVLLYSWRIKELGDITIASPLQNELQENKQASHLEIVLDAADQYYGIILRPASIGESIKVDFKPKLETFKRLLKLAIHKKYGKDGDSWMPFIDGTQQAKDFKSFRHLDKSIILRTTRPFFPEFERVYLKRSNQKICLSIPGKNIFLPPVSIDQDTNPDLIFDKYLEHYKYLQAKRGIN